MMEIIVEGNSDVKKLITASFDEKKTYKLTLFALRRETENGLLLSNTLSGELVLLSKSEAEAIQSLPAKMTAEVKDLVSDAFLVSESLDEIRRVEQLRAIFLRRIEAGGTFNLYSILPTTDCNARCFYCYESDIEHISMTEKTAAQLVDFIVKHHGEKKVFLHWFGGEPTLGVKRIDQICTSLNEKSIPFTSNMVSNSYLFTKDLVHHAKELWNLQEIQITLDGTEHVYNKTKAYINAADNPYKRVLQNIRYFLDEEIRVNIRLNMDLHNYENLDCLIDELIDRFRGNEFLQIYIRPLKENAGFEPICHSEADLIRRRKEFLKLQKKLEENSWSQFWRSSLPSLRANSCMADNPAFLQCTPNGIFSKCEDKIFEHTIGTIEEGITKKDVVRWWQEREALYECKTCTLYPSCIHLLKHCPSCFKECDREEYSHQLQYYNALMLQTYENWKSLDRS